MPPVRGNLTNLGALNVVKHDRIDRGAAERPVNACRRRMGAPRGKRAVSGERQAMLEAEGRDTAAGEGGGRYRRSAGGNE
jgi:hypothetical protein